MQENQTNVMYWLGRLSGHMAQFQAAPSSGTKANLLMTMSEYQKAVEDGLDIPKTVPPPIRSARSFSEWYRRMLDEAMAMYRIRPCEDRMNVMKDHLKGYQDAVAMGRVRL